MCEVSVKFDMFSCKHQYDFAFLLLNRLSRLLITLKSLMFCVHCTFMAVMLDIRSVWCMIMRAWGRVGVTWNWKWDMCIRNLGFMAYWAILASYDGIIVFKTRRLNWWFKTF